MEQIINLSAVRRKIPNTTRIHLTFHVSQFKTSGSYRPVIAACFTQRPVTLFTCQQCSSLYLPCFNVKTLDRLSQLSLITIFSINFCWDVTTLLSVLLLDPKHNITIAGLITFWSKIVNNGLLFVIESTVL